MVPLGMNYTSLYNCIPIQYKLFNFSASKGYQKVKLKSLHSQLSSIIYIFELLESFLHLYLIIAIKDLFDEL